MAEAKKSWVNVRMTATERSKLNASAKAKGVSAAELIRQGLKSQGVNL
jgi:hypothetical protein